jgi:hypothetical protein
MTTPRRPVVAGITAGAGTSTVATVLHGIDAATATSTADILVSRDDATSLVRLARTLLNPTRPVVAVVLGTDDVDLPVHLHGTRGGMLAALCPAAHVVVVPYVAALDQGRVPADHLPLLLARDPRTLPGTLRACAAALREVAVALVAAGGLTRNAGPALWPGLGPVERLRSAVCPVEDGLDDDTLEQAAS